MARLNRPAATQPLQIDWGYAANIGLIHLLSLLILCPWLCSWPGVVLAVIGCPIYGLLGITLCYHRILTHQSLIVPKWLERVFATLGVCCLQDTPARWVAVHRLHHQHSDCAEDPHSPLVSFLWAHFGWILIRHREHSRVTFFEKYARDILRDPYYLALERNLMWFWIYWLQVVSYFVGGLIAGWAASGDWSVGATLGLSVVVWGVFLRTIVLWHATWAVNSITHICGYRNYETADESRNQWFIALLVYGEGWHNNHHADQRAAAHGHRWWEFDATYAVIRALEFTGLARNVIRPRVWRSRLEVSQALETVN